MPIPEALAIATSTIAIYSFIRVSIDTIIRDKETWKGQQKALRKAEAELTSWRRRLGDWHENWMVSTDESDEAKEHNAVLYEKIWAAECSHIKLCFNNIKEAIDDFTPWFKKELKRAGTKRGKIRQIFGGKDKLNTATTELPRLMQLLETESLSRFRDAHPDLEGRQVTNAEIHKVIRQHLLLALARSSFDASRRLHNSCTTVANGNFMINLVLDFLDSTTQGESDPVKFEIHRRKQLSKMATHKQHLSFVFIAKKVEWGVCMRTSVRPQTTPPSNSRSSFLEAADHVYNTPIPGGGEDDPAESGFASSPEGYHFSVRRDIRNDGQYTQALSNSTIKEALAAQNLQNLASLGFERMNLPSLKQAEMIYRLAECGLLLLKTDWLSRICNCRIMHRARVPVAGISESNRHKTPQQYIFRQGHDAGVPPQGPQQPPCFCAVAPANIGANIGMGCLFHLGIVLTEIALGTHLSNINVNIPIANAANQLNQANPLVQFQTTRFDPSNPEHIGPLKLVLDRMSGTVAVGNAVAHCLRSTAMPDRVDEDHLVTYYEQVLDPLRVAYETRLTT